MHRSNITKTQNELNICVDKILDVFNESKLNLYETTYILGSILISIGVSLGAPEMTKDNFHDYNNPTLHFPTWLRNMGTLILTWLGRFKILEEKENINEKGDNNDIR